MTGPIAAEKESMIPPAFQQKATILKLDPVKTQELWDAAMSLTLTPETVLQFAGGAKVRALDFEAGLRSNPGGEVVYAEGGDPRVEAAVAESVERRFPSSRKWARNEVRCAAGVVWYSTADAAWYVEDGKAAQMFLSASAAAAHCDTAAAADALYADISALQKTPIVKVEADDLRAAVAP